MWNLNKNFYIRETKIAFFKEGVEQILCFGKKEGTSEAESFRKEFEKMYPIWKEEAKNEHNKKI